MAGAAAAAWLLAVGLADAQQTAGSTPPDPTGDWLVAKKVARIRIADCYGQMWGVVQWEEQPGGVDIKNPDPTLRSRPTLGMPILLGMARSKVNQWDGQIYNSEDGHTYSASISLLNPNMLRVQGCVLGFLCGGENWTRVDPQDIANDAQARVPQAPANPQARSPPAPNKPRTAATSQPPDADDICLRLFGPARLPHERGLK